MQRFFMNFIRRTGRFRLLIPFSVVFLGISGIIPGQNTQMSLYSFHPLSTNPSYTGSFEGDWRFTAGYRNQKVVTAQSYQTAITSFDGHLYLFNQKIGGGLYLLNDQSGVGGLMFTKIYGSVAYEFDFHNNKFGFGFQAGFISGKVNSWGIWDNATGAFTAPNGEEYFNESTSYADVNIGISWKRKMNKLLPQLALGLFHVNNPNISFFEGNEKQSSQFLIDTRVDFELTEALTFTPLLLFNAQQKTRYSIVGADLKFDLPGKRNPVKAVFGGCHLQNGILENASSVLIQLGTRIKRVNIGLGYEMNLGAFGETTGKTGAFEVAIVYESISTVLNSYSIPCERF
jgi:type IX secretion system PorP/SprF family membrane protein